MADVDLIPGVPYYEQLEGLTDEEHTVDGGVVVGLGTYEPPAQGSIRQIPIAGGRRTDMPRNTINADESSFLESLNQGGNYSHDYNWDNHYAYDIENTYHYPVLPYVAGPGIIIEGNVISVDEAWIKALFFACS